MNTLLKNYYKKEKQEILKAILEWVGLFLGALLAGFLTMVFLTLLAIAQ